jgi:hypothetical protein
MPRRARLVPEPIPRPPIIRVTRMAATGGYCAFGKKAHEIPPFPCVPLWRSFEYPTTPIDVPDDKIAPIRVWARWREPYERMTEGMSMPKLAPDPDGKTDDELRQRSSRGA